jgi:hypothetical protein
MAKQQNSSHIYLKNTIFNIFPKQWMEPLMSLKTVVFNMTVFIQACIICHMLQTLPKFGICLNTQKGDQVRKIIMNKLQN